VQSRCRRTGTSRRRCLRPAEALFQSKASPELRLSELPIRGQQPRFRPGAPSGVVRPRYGMPQIAAEAFRLCTSAHLGARGVALGRTHRALLSFTSLCIAQKSYLVVGGEPWRENPDLRVVEGGPSESTHPPQSTSLRARQEILTSVLISGWRQSWREQGWWPLFPTIARVGRAFPDKSRPWRRHEPARRRRWSRQRRAPPTAER
jgi:hypothetical protein